MQKHIEFGQTTSESSILFTTEECLAHLYALELLEQSVDEPEVLQWARLETATNPFGAEQWIWDRCDVLRADLTSAVNRLSRGYSAYTFNDDDSGFLGYALNRLASSADGDLGSEQAGLAQIIPVARHVMANCVETFSSVPLPINR